MDVTLLASSLALSSYLPRCLLSSSSYDEPAAKASSSSTMTVSSSSSSFSWILTTASSLSFMLLALSILEATPSSWTMFLRQRHSLVIVYRFLLSSMSTVVLILSPSLIGAQLIQHILQLFETYHHQCNNSNSSTIENNKKSRRRSSSCWIRTLCISMSVLSQVLHIVLIIPLLRLIYYLRRRLGRIRGNIIVNNSGSSGPILALTTSSSKDSMSSPTISGSSNRKCANGRGGLFFILFGSLCGVLLTMGILAIVAPLFIRTTTSIINTTHNEEDGSRGSTSPTTITMTMLLPTTVSWLCAIGILLSACLNGFGSVSMPYSCLAGLYLEPIRPEAIAKAEVELQKAQSLLEERRDALGSVSLILPTGGGDRGSSLSSSTTEHHNATASTCSANVGSSSNASTNAAPLSGGGGTSWNTMTKMLSRAAGNGSGSATGGTASKAGKKRFSDLTEGVNQRRKLIITEMEFLNVLVEEMKEELSEMRQAQHAAAMARTTMGQVNSWLGVVFSIILLMRLGSAMLFVWRHHRGLISTSIRGSDPVTMGMLWLIGNNYLTMTQQDYNTLSQFISLLLTAVLSFSQVRTFWRTVDYIYRRLISIYRKMYGHDPSSSASLMTPNTDETNTSIHAAAGKSSSSNSIYAHIVSSLMICYFVACIVLTKMMLPVDYRKSFSAALWQGEAREEEDENDDNGILLFRIRTSAVNTVFIASALISTFVLALLLGIQRQNTFRHLTAWSSSSSTAMAPASAMSKSNGSSSGNMNNMSGLEP